MPHFGLLMYTSTLLLPFHEVTYKQVVLKTRDIGNHVQNIISILSKMQCHTYMCNLEVEKVKAKAKVISELVK